MVLTFVVVTDEAHHDDALRAARDGVDRAPVPHPRRDPRPRPGQAAARRRGRRSATARPGETVLLRLYGELGHAPGVGRDSAAAAGLAGRGRGGRATRPTTPPPTRSAGWRSAGSPTRPRCPRPPTGAAPRRRRHYAPGDTDLAWTRLTPWRALLAAALDQHPVRITGATVEAEPRQPERRPAGRLAAVAGCRCRSTATAQRRARASRRCALHSSHGDIALDRPGRAARDVHHPGRGRPAGGAAAAQHRRAARRGAAPARPRRRLRGDGARVRSQPGRPRHAAEAGGGREHAPATTTAAAQQDGQEAPRRSRRQEDRPPRRPRKKTAKKTPAGAAGGA